MKRLFRTQVSDTAGVEVNGSARQSYIDENLPAVLEGLNSQKEQLKDTVISEWERDTAEYDITTTRAGDFLTVEVSRVPRLGDRVVRESHSINLGHTTRITYQEGSPPKLDGKRIEIHLYKMNYFLLFHDECLIPPFRETVGAKPTTYDYSSYSHEITEIYAVGTVDEIPTFSEDGIITFEGTDTHIFMPFGTVGAVYRKIMTEIEAGYKSPMTGTLSNQTSSTS